MLIRDLHGVHTALVAIGMDCGASVRPDAALPAAWHARAAAAEIELSTLSSEELAMLAAGEEAEQAAIAARCPAAHALLSDAFDGDLSEIVFRPWGDIVDARAAEAGMSREEMLRKLEQDGMTDVVRPLGRMPHDERARGLAGALEAADREWCLSESGGCLAMLVTTPEIEPVRATTEHWANQNLAARPELAICMADALLRHWLPRMTVPDARRRAEAALRAMEFTERRDS